MVACRIPFPLDFRFWILDLDLGPVFGTGLGFDNIDPRIRSITSGCKHIGGIETGAKIYGYGMASMTTLLCCVGMFWSLDDLFESWTISKWIAVAVISLEVCYATIKIYGIRARKNRLLENYILFRVLTALFYIIGYTGCWVATAIDWKSNLMSWKVWCFGVSITLSSFLIILDLGTTTLLKDIRDFDEDSDKSYM